MVNDRCPVCDRSVFVSWPKSGLYSCLVCTHLWQPHYEPFDYGDKYVAGYADKPTRDMAFLRLGFLSAFHAQGGKLLDVGAGDGAFVRAALQAGFDAHAQDIAPRSDDLPRVTALDGEFDVVTCFDSLEHFPDLLQIFRAKAAVYVVTIPHRPQDLTDDNAKEWRHYKPDEHLHYFSKESLGLFFHRAGYRLAAHASVEDAIRKGLTVPNTMTYVFRRGRK